MKSKICCLALFLLLASGACKKDFLERQPENELTFDKFFKTADHAVQATNATYEQFRFFNEPIFALGYVGLTDIISDDSDKGSVPDDQPPLDQIDNFTFDAANTYFKEVYSGYYQAIARANVAIENIPRIDMDAALRDRLVGENKLLRAYAYYLLVQWFGDLPIITHVLTTEEYYAQTRQPVAEVYAQIEQDLKAAEAVLPDSYGGTDKGRATKWAAKGLLAKLAMLRKDYAAAEQYSGEIINSAGFSLTPKYQDIFTQASENNQESIFEMQAVSLPTQQSAGPGSSTYNMVQGVRGTPNLGWGFNRPSDNLVSAYENPNDPRRRATIIVEGDQLPDGSIVVDNPNILNARFNKKAWAPDYPSLQDNGPTNLRVIRYADILLLMAEAINEQNRPSEALPYLNQVRQRARASSPVPIPGLLPDVSITDQGQLREKIRKERRVELAMEQQRWFDLLRWGIAAPTMQAVGKAFVSGKHELLPIPQTEVDLTDHKIEQNPNY